MTSHAARLMALLIVAVPILLTSCVFALEARAGDVYLSRHLVPGSFGATLSGHWQVLYAAESDGGTPFGDFAVTDDRGTGTGWCVSVSATRFENRTYPGKNLPFDSLTMPRLKVVSFDASATAPPGEFRAAATVDNDDGGVVMVSCTDHGQGMGTYDFAAANDDPWELIVRPDTYEGVYTSTITVTVSPLSL